MKPAIIQTMTPHHVFTQSEAKAVQARVKKAFPDFEIIVKIKNDGGSQLCVYIASGPSRFKSETRHFKNEYSKFFNLNVYHLREIRQPSLRKMAEQIQQIIFKVVPPIFEVCSCGHGSENTSGTPIHGIRYFHAIYLGSDDYKTPYKTKRK